MSDRAIRTRPPDAGDAPALLLLEEACFTGYYEPHRFSRAHFLAYLRNEQVIRFVATEGGRVVGYVLGSVGRGRTRRAARLESLAIAPAHRQRGIGSRLLARFLRDAKGRGSLRVVLEVAMANAAGLRFFEHHGFTIVRHLPAYYTPTHDGVRMRLVL